MTRGEVCHHLEPKTMAVLFELACQPNRVVNRSELLDKVWPRTFSGDEALSRCVSQLRSFFEDDSRDPHYIETIPKKGYRLVATCIPFEPQEPVETPLEPGEQAQAANQISPAPPAVHSATATARKLRTTQVLVMLGAVALLLKISAMGLQSHGADFQE